MPMIYESFVETSVVQLCFKKAQHSVMWHRRRRFNQWNITGESSYKQILQKKLNLINELCFRMSELNSVQNVLFTTAFFANTASHQNFLRTCE